MRIKSISAQRKKSLREKIMQRQGGLCHYCSCEMKVIDYSKEEYISGNVATFEHLHDVWSRHGRIDDHRHVVLACFDCNRQRGIVRSKMAYLLVMKSFKTKAEGRRFISMDSGDIIKLYRELKLYNLLGDYPDKDVDIEAVKHYTTGMEVAG